MLEPIVLLVDDEAPFVDTMTKRLTKRKLTVFKSYSGEEALETLKENSQIDLVILDVKMPGMDGIETLKEIRKEFPLVEVIMLTGHATVDTAIEGMKLGAFDYLMKPTDTKDLVEKIKRASDRKREQEARIREAEIQKIVERRGW
mgnify:CR=1 FL=1